MADTETRIPAPIVPVPPEASSELESWMAAEAALRDRWQRAVPAPVAQWREQSMQLDGLSQLQALLRGEAPPPSIGRTLDFLMIEVERGRAVFQGTPGAGHLNPMGSVHGGWYASVLDSALGCSVHSMLPAGRAYTTLELKVNMIRALSPKVQRVRAVGQVIHAGTQTATAEARLLGPDGRLYAHATTTCLIFAMRPHTAPTNPTAEKPSA